MEFHPIADCFKLLDGTAFDGLVADIRDHGVIQPIVVYEGMILDGRNRYRAAQEVGAPCPSVAYEGDDPIRHVVALNHMRRHESDAEKAIAASKLASWAVGTNQHYQKEGAAKRGSLSLHEAADLVGVTHAKVERARAIENKGTDELKEAVKNGSVSLTHGEKIARLPKDQQGEAIDSKWTGPEPEPIPSDLSALGTRATADILKWGTLKTKLQFAEIKSGKSLNALQAAFLQQEGGDEASWWEWFDGRFPIERRSAEKQMKAAL